MQNVQIKTAIMKFNVLVRVVAGTTIMDTHSALNTHKFILMFVHSFGPTQRQTAPVSCRLHLFIYKLISQHIHTHALINQQNKKLFRAGVLF